MRKLIPYRTSLQVTVVFLATLVLVGLSAMFMIGSVLPEHPRNQLSNKLMRYIMSHQIGEVPTQEAINSVADEVGFTLIVAYSGKVTSSSNAKIPQDALQRILTSETEGYYETSDNGEDYFVVRNGPTVVIVSNYVEGLSNLARVRLLAGVAAIALVLLLSFIVLRRTVSGLAPLTDAVRAVADGNLDTRVQGTAKGEIGTLQQLMNVMTEKLQQSEKAKRDMLIAIGHEFSSPIARLMFQAERIENEGLREKVHANLLRISALFRALTSAEALGSSAAISDRDVLPFPDIIEEICSGFENIEIHYEFSNQSLDLHLNRMVLELLLSNFLTNAHNHAPGSPVEVSAHHARDSLQLTVTDRGPGVSEDFLREIGEPLKRQDKARQFDTGGGLGLGLYICSRIVARTAGTMKVRNAPGGGFEVTISLPCVGTMRNRTEELTA